MLAGAAVLAALHPIHPLGVPRPPFRGCWRAGGTMGDDGLWVPLGEAAQRFVDQRLILAADKAREQLRNAGGRPRVRGRLTWDGTGGLTERERHGHSAYRQWNAAHDAVVADLHRRLVTGELAARGRPGGLAVESRTIATSLWSHLRILNASRGILIGIDKVRWYMAEVARAADLVRAPRRVLASPGRRKATEQEIIDFMVKLQLAGVVKSMEVDHAAFLEAHPHLTAPVKFFQDVRGPYALKKGRPPKPK